MKIVERKYLPSFAGRVSRKLSPYYKELLVNFLPEVGFSKENLEVLLTRYNKIKFEIGFGGGEHLLARAIESPDTLFIGCDPYLSGVVRVLSSIKELNLGNILIYPHDARVALEMLEDKSMEKVYILFPDPWPKTKQKKRRIVNTETLQIIHQKLEEKGKLVIATDHSDYANHIMKTISKAKLFEFEEENYDIYKCPVGWITTKYEEKALAGRSSYFLLRKV